MKLFRMHPRLALIGLAAALSLATVAATLEEKKPRIKTDEESFDFKSIKQGDVPEHIFIIHNIGDDTLRITNTQASCGCTSTLMADKNIAPGGESKLRVVFNSAGKSGHISKTVFIYSNDPQEPSKTVSISADIQTAPPSVHAGTFSSMAHLDGLFQGDCASCHVEKGRGHTGKELYEFDCAICHGSKGDGKSAPDLHDQLMARHSKEGLTTILADGIPETMMPGFSKVKGGPLSDDEIASLVTYITQVSAETKGSINKQ